MMLPESADSDETCADCGQDQEDCSCQNGPFLEGSDEQQTPKADPEPPRHDRVTCPYSMLIYNEKTGEIDTSRALKNWRVAVKYGNMAQAQDIYEHIWGKFSKPSEPEKPAPVEPPPQVVRAATPETHVKSATWIPRAIEQIRVLSGQPAAPGFGFTSHNLTHWLAGYRKAIQEILRMLEKLEEEEGLANRS